MQFRMATDLEGFGRQYFHEVPVPIPEPEMQGLELCKGFWHIHSGTLHAIQAISAKAQPQLVFAADKRLVGYDGWLTCELATASSNL